MLALDNNWRVCNLVNGLERAVEIHGNGNQRALQDDLFGPESL